MEGEEEQSPVRDASSVAFSDPSSLVTCPFSCFPSCLVARVHWAEIRSLLCDWLALGIFVTSSFLFFQRYRGYFLVLNFGFSRENYPRPFFIFYLQRCPCSVVLHPVSSCLLPVHLLAPDTKSNQLTPFKSSGSLFNVSPISRSDFKHHTTILQMCHRMLIGYSALRSGRISRLV